MHYMSRIRARKTWSSSKKHCGFYFSNFFNFLKKETNATLFHFMCPKKLIFTALYFTAFSLSKPSTYSKARDDSVESAVCHSWKCLMSEEKAVFILIAVLKRIKPCILPLYKLSLPYQKLTLSEVIYNFRCL